MSRLKLPTAKDLAKLPRLAIVAFAARCARRMLPLFKYGWNDAPDEIVKDVENAIQLAEKFSSGKTESSDTANKAALAALAASEAALAASEAAKAVAAAATAASASITAATAANAANAVNAVNAVNKATIIRDYELLKVTSEAEGWTEDTPVPPEFFETRKLKFKKLSDESVPLEIYIDPGSASKETIQEVLESISDLHRAAGGLGLEFRPDGFQVVAAKEVEK